MSAGHGGRRRSFHGARGLPLSQAPASFSSSCLFLQTLLQRYWQQRLSSQWPSLGTTLQGVGGLVLLL